MTHLDQYIIAMRFPLWLVFVALALLFSAARGIGKLLLRQCDDDLCALALGMVVLALARLLPWELLPYSRYWGWLLLSYPAYCGASAVATRFPRYGRWSALTLAALGVFTAASALLPPYAWDEQVYQTALWMRFPGLPVLADDPYSAYPLLPQFFLDWGRAPGGLELPRLAVWLLTLILAGKAFAECSRRCGSSLHAAILSAAVMLSPVALVLQRSFYAETFIALFALAGWLCLEQESCDRRSIVLSGVFAGACAAVKLTGIGMALMLVVKLLLGKNRRDIGWFVLGAVVAALPFYLRIFMFWGDPVYPFGSMWFGSEGAALVARFFAELGSYRYGLNGLPGVALGWLFACFDARIYDGVVCGSGILAMILALAATAFCRKDRRAFLADPAALLAGYLFWTLSSQQTRFLYPLFFPAALALAGNLPKFGKTGARIAISGVALGMAFAVYGAYFHLRHYATAWRILPTARRYPARFLAVADREYVGILEKIAEVVPAGKKLLLLFERRTLYIPADFTHGTPFFQEKLLTPPPGTSDELSATMKKFDYVLLGSASGLPDHLETYDGYESSVRSQTAELVRSGKLRTLYNSESGRYFLFEVTCGK